MIAVRCNRGIRCRHLDGRALMMFQTDIQKALLDFWRSFPKWTCRIHLKLCGTDKGKMLKLRIFYGNCIG